MTCLDRARRIACALGTCTLAAGCAQPSITDPSTPWPRFISALDLDPRGVGDDAHGDGLAYDVGHPLWADGAGKHRLLLLGDAEVIDDRDRDAWRFPAGTVALKTLAVDGRAIETRAIRALGDGAWEYETYRWDADGSDAERLDLDAPVVVADAAGDHVIPSRLQCRQCHESATTPLIGLTELQLGDAGPRGQTELQRFDALGLLRAGAPARPHTAAGPDPATTAVLGWFVGNCLHCHNGGDGENASFDLDPAVAVDAIVDRPTQSSASGSGQRVVPGDPDRSLLFLAVSGDHDDPEIDAMPPVPTMRRDDASIAALRAWIEGLAP